MIEKLVRFDFVSTTSSDGADNMLAKAEGPPEDEPITTYGVPSWASIPPGMGIDGAKGMLTLKEAGAYTSCRDEKSSAVYGMPKAASRIRAARIEADLDGIASLQIDELSTSLIR